MKKSIITLLAVTTAVVLLLLGIYSIPNSDSTTTVSVNLVYGDSCDPAFLGGHFSDRLLKAEKEGQIDLHGLYLTSRYNPDSDNSNEVTAVITEGKDAVPGTASKLSIRKVKYTMYSKEYIEKYYKPGNDPGSPGYYEYYIDLA